MRHSFIFFTISLVLLVACSNDDDQNDQINKGSETTLIFGKYAGFCIGDCFDVFKIDEGKLEEDRVVDFYTEDYTFNGSFTFSNAQYTAYKNILDEIPEELVNGANKTYGCPDCTDQGGYYIEIRFLDGSIKKYTIDTDNTDDQSEALLIFKDKISKVINGLDS